MIPHNAQGHNESPVPCVRFLHNPLGWTRPGRLLIRWPLSGAGDARRGQAD